MMTNYSQWHTERAPTGRKVNSVEEITTLNEKVDLIMSQLTKQPSIGPHDVPLNSLVAQEQVDVNFIARNNFNNYGNNNTYPSNKNPSSELESMLRDFITTQKAFNKNVEEKLAKIDNLSLKVESLALDIEMLKIRTSPLEENKA